MGAWNRVSQQVSKKFGRTRDHHFGPQLADQSLWSMHFPGFFSCDGKVTRSQSVPETPNVCLTKAWGHAVTRMEGGPNRALAPPARSHKRTYPRGETNFDDTVRVM